MKQKKIINFTIIAHVDHGKSTLSDRIMEICHSFHKRYKGETVIQDRILDSMELEQERGITIKSQTVRLEYKDIILNLHDTPGHVDFSFEVSRSLRACENAILLVDASQGVQAQTISHLSKAKDLGLNILPVLNKIDLPASNPDRCIDELEELGVNTDNICQISAKTGDGVDHLLDYVITKFTSVDTVNVDSKPSCLIIDSWYDNYKGITFLVRVLSGQISKDDKVTSYFSKQKFNIKSLGYFTPEEQEVDRIYTGDIAYVVSGLKIPNTIPGDYLVDQKDIWQDFETPESTDPMVFYTVYMTHSDKVNEVIDAMHKYHMNDPAFRFSIEHNPVYGTSFSCGFLGHLHCEIFLERMHRDFNISLAITSPSVKYHVYTTDDNMQVVTNHRNMPDSTKIIEIQEPFVKLTIYLHQTKSLGSILDLCAGKRASKLNTEYYGENKIKVTCEIPLGELIVGFHEKLKSISSGYASMKYDLLDYRISNIVKLVVMINDKSVHECGLLTHRDNMYNHAKTLCNTLKDNMSRSQFKTKIQVVCSKSKDNGSYTPIASSTLSAYRKDVIAKCYGGDITRKKKLLANQAAGKKRRKGLSKDVASHRAISFSVWSKAVNTLE